MIDNQKLQNLTILLCNQKGVGVQFLKKVFPKREDLEMYFESNKKITLENLSEQARNLLGDIESRLDVTSLNNIDFLANIAKKSVKALCYWDDLYPETLKEVYDFPPILYYKGNINLLNEDIFSVVGTRNLSEYGKKYGSYFSKELSLNNFVIISGLAIGIDKVAHMGALEGGKKTIAVIPGGPHKATPSIHSNLYNQILDSGGLIISEDYPGKEIHPGMFASRNRIIAGLSRGVLIVEADIDSGSLITADLANDFGREVFALPGKIDQKQSNGTNKIIKEGRAKLVQNLEDILVEFGKSVKMSGFESQKLTKLEETVLSILNKVNSLSIDEIGENLQLTIDETLKTCVNMELNGLIKKDLSGKYFVS